MNPVEQYAENVAKVADVDANVIVGLDPKVETFSRRAGLARNAGQRWGCIVCKLLGYVFGADHCDRAVAAGEVE